MVQLRGSSPFFADTNAVMRQILPVMFIVAQNRPEIKTSAVILKLSGSIMRSFQGARFIAAS